MLGFSVLSVFHVLLDLIEQQLPIALEESCEHVLPNPRKWYTSCTRKINIPRLNWQRSRFRRGSQQLPPPPSHNAALPQPQHSPEPECDKRAACRFCVVHFVSNSREAVAVEPVVGQLRG